MTTSSYNLLGKTHRFASKILNMPTPSFIKIHIEIWFNKPMGRISINYSLCGFNCFLDLVSLNFIIIQLTLNERKSNEWILKSLFDLNTVIVYLSSTRLGDDNVIGIRWRGGNCCSFMNVKKMIKTAFNQCIWTRIIAQLHTKYL